MEKEPNAKPIDGDKPYQEKARQALPLLVRQARARNPIYYSSLAHELHMPNPRNLNYVLGCIGESLLELGKEWRQSIPPIQCLVINMHEGLPGEGIGWFLDQGGLAGYSATDYNSLSTSGKRRVFETELERVYAFQRWRDVLDDFELSEPTPPAPALNEAASVSYGGESDAHIALKNYVASHPALVGLRKNWGKGRLEEPLLSGDALDVSFHKGGVWRAAEVKSKLSSTPDVQRGIFQCVKYLSVMSAMSLAYGRDKEVDVVLVLEGSLPEELIPLKNTLGVKVIENAYNQV